MARALGLIICNLVATVMVPRLGRSAARVAAGPCHRVRNPIYLAALLIVVRRADEHRC
jgi:hypothetical protein